MIGQKFCKGQIFRLTPDINPNPTHLSKHQTLSPNNQFPQHI